MNRQQKEKEVAWLRERFQSARVLVLTNFTGLTVSEMNQLRSMLRKEGASFKVLKNTLARLAYPDTDVALLSEDLVGPRAAAWTDTDEKAVAMAKVLVDFVKTHPNLELIRGVVQGQKLAPSDVETLSKLPSREQLLARLCGTMNAPVGAFVNTLAAVVRSLLNVLTAIEEKKGGLPEAAQN